VQPVDVLFLLTALLYAAAAVLFVRFLLGAQTHEGEAASRVSPAAPAILAIAAAFHATHVCWYSLVLKVCPVNGVHFPLSVGAMFTGFAFLGLRTRFRLDAAGAFVAPLALATLLASRFVGGGMLAPSPSMKSALLPVHILMNLLGIALFSLASSAAVLYLLQEKRLKDKRLTGLFERLPPLDALDRAEHLLLLAGFNLLTVGILTGTVWAVRSDAFVSTGIWRTVFGYATWMLIAAVLILRASRGWRGRRAAYGTLVGFGFSMIVLGIYLLRNGGGS
jgi:ABC-type uncharacterized transport system permease subunit